MLRVRNWFRSLFSPRKSNGSRRNDERASGHVASSTPVASSKLDKYHSNQFENLKLVDMEEKSELEKAQKEGVLFATSPVPCSMVTESKENKDPYTAPNEGARSRSDTGGLPRVVIYADSMNASTDETKDNQPEQIRQQALPHGSLLRSELMPCENEVTPAGLDYVPSSSSRDSPVKFTSVNSSSTDCLSPLIKDPSVASPSGPFADANNNDVRLSQPKVRTRKISADEVGTRAITLTTNLAPIWRKKWRKISVDSLNDRVKPYSRYAVQIERPSVLQAAAQNEPSKLIVVPEGSINASGDSLSRSPYRILPAARWPKTSVDSINSRIDRQPRPRFASQSERPSGLQGLTQNELSKQFLLPEGSVYASGESVLDREGTFLPLRTPPASRWPKTSVDSINARMNRQSRRHVDTPSERLRSWTFNDKEYLDATLALASSSSTAGSQSPRWSQPEAQSNQGSTTEAGNKFSRQVLETRQSFTKTLADIQE